MILLDSNIPMNLVGAPHPHKADAQRILERLVSDRERLVTDAEVVQEILHRYVAIRRRDAIQAAFDALLGIADQVLPIDVAAADRAKDIVLGHQHVSARHAVHLAIMEEHGIERIFSFDSGFDGFPGISRISLRTSSLGKLKKKGGIKAPQVATPPFSVVEPILRKIRV